MDDDPIQQQRPARRSQLEDVARWLPEQEQNNGLLPQPNNGLLADDAFAEYFVAALDEQHDAEEEIPVRSQPSRPEEEAANEEGQYTFGRDYDSALHHAIREGAVDAALELIRFGAPVAAENAKRVTPLILASQRGLLPVVQSLLGRGANPLSISATGSTALLQASHFGHCNIVVLLLEHGAMIEMANFKNTTPLMRASQEGHTSVVELLLARGARVNRRNNEHMSALMLASQRGHANVVRLLLHYKADIDAMTAQRSTSLLLACKRENIEVVRELVTAGCELQMKDARGRTAREVTQRRNFKELLKLLEPAKQVELMQRRSRVQRSYVMVNLWNLLQQGRASVPLITDSGKGLMSIHEFAGNDIVMLGGRSEADEALLRTMTLPAPMVELIASYMPLPHLWPERIMILTKRCGIDADSAISCTFDLIDEVLEEGGFLEACTMAKITPPSHFTSWEEWRSWGYKHNHLDPTPSAQGRVNALSASLPGMPKLSTSDPAAPTPMNARDWRRGICYLQILAHRSPVLMQGVLMQPPFNMPAWVIDQLITVNDIQSLSRRMGSRGAHFEATVAIELVMLASSVVSWYNREMNGLQLSTITKHV